MLHTVIWSRLIGRFFFLKKKKKQIMIFYSRKNKRVQQSDFRILFDFSMAQADLQYKFYMQLISFYKATTLLSFLMSFFNRGSLISLAQWSTSFRFRGTSGYSSFLYCLSTFCSLVRTNDFLLGDKIHFPFQFQSRGFHLCGCSGQLHEMQYAIKSKLYNFMRLG